MKIKNLLNLKTIASTLTIVALGASSAFASFGVTGGNTTTGTSSSNTNTWSVSDTGVFSLANTRNQTNSLGVAATTGGNSFGSNTQIGNIVAGGINGTANIVTTPQVGPILDLSMLGGGSGTVGLTNGTTGASSANSNSASVSNSVSVGISNSNTISNSVSATVNSGGNSVANNTVVGGFHGGDANYNVNVSNPGSGGLGVSGVIMPALPVMDTVSAGNNITGSGSSNTNSVGLSSSTSVGISNTSNVTNGVSVSANSGGNSVANNTVVGDVSTGGSTVNVGISN